ncbi:MAG: WG repeat-containing protein [Clostridiales bacterium]|nr:WG repeat-containing protein [Clostridiales bacterium]
MGAAAGLLCMPFSVKAETTLELVNTLEESTDWIYDTNLLRVEGDSGYGLMQTDGTELTDRIYASSFSFSCGYLEAALYTDDVDNNGVLTVSGEELVPFEYTYIDVLSSHWILAYQMAESDTSNYDFTMTYWFSDRSDVYFLIDAVDVYYVDGDTAVVAGTLTRDHFMEAYAIGKYINIRDRETDSVSTYDSSFSVVASGLGSIYSEPDGISDLYEINRFYEDGLYGLKDGAGNVILALTYDYISDFQGGYAEVSNAGVEAYGLIDEQGQLVLPVEYDNILTSYDLPVDGDYSSYGYNAAGYFAVEVDGKIGFVTEGGNVTLTPSYAEALMEVNGASAIYTDAEGQEHLIAADGTDTALADYDSVYDLNYSSGLLYRVADEDYNYGLLDWHGNMILPISEEYSDIDLSGDGNYLLVERGYSGDSTEIYLVNYDLTALETETGEETADSAVETASEADVDEDGTAEAAATLESAIALLDTDADANGAAIRSLLESAAASLTDTNPDAASLVNSAIVLLDGDTVDAVSVRTLLVNAQGLL